MTLKQIVENLDDLFKGAASVEVRANEWTVIRQHLEPWLQPDPVQEDVEARAKQLRRDGIKLHREH